jgi:hypothetical protein
MAGDVVQLTDIVREDRKAVVTGLRIRQEVEPRHEILEQKGVTHESASNERHDREVPPEKVIAREELVEDLPGHREDRMLFEGAALEQKPSGIPGQAMNRLGVKVILARMVFNASKDVPGGLCPRDKVAGSPLDDFIAEDPSSFVRQGIVAARTAKSGLFGRGDKARGFHALQRDVDRAALDGSLRPLDDLLPVARAALQDLENEALDGRKNRVDDGHEFRPLPLFDGARLREDLQPRQSPSFLSTGTCLDRG